MNKTWKCDICRKDCDDPVEYGDIFEKCGVKVHYYCLMLSTHLPQKGEDTSGIFGFFITDIRKEIKAAKNRICFYCKEKHASIKCGTCEIYFHLKCGLEKNCLFQFHDKFKSYCHQHHNINHNTPHESYAGCFICRQKMGNYNPLTSITSECCETDGWVHRRCLKKYALAAGYYLKCVWCTNAEFRNYVRLHGIFVPDRDAAWEKLKGAYSELYESMKKICVAAKCACPKGKEFKSKKWDMDLCSTCGASAIHKICWRNKTFHEEFICKNCKKLSLVENMQTKLMSRSSGIPVEVSTFDLTLHMSKSQKSDSVEAILFDLTQQASLNFMSVSSEIDEQLFDSSMRNKEETGNEKFIDSERFFICNRDTLQILGSLRPGDVKDQQDAVDRYVEDKTVGGKLIDFPGPGEYTDMNKILDEFLQECLRSETKKPDTITLSDSDSDASVSKLLDKIDKKQNIAVPKQKNKEKN